ncbi:MAG: aminotransferase class III-fold pyridoxal phosphate-dependent enzyme [Terriglobales bacterium]
MPGGVSTNIRLPEGPQKLIVKRASGSRVWTIDDRELVDFVCGYGTVLLGYGFPALTQRQMEVLGHGISYNATNPFEIEAADRLVSIFPDYDMVRFGVTGSEATTAAIGLSRTVTGRSAIAVFSNHYHGWHGPTKAPRTVFPPPGNFALPEVPLFELPFNDTQVCADFFRRYGDSLACVIFEIVMINGGGYEPTPEFIQLLHAARDEHGFLLIADEVITGFRVGLRGAQAKFGVSPDLTVLGKALGGGVPIGAVLGRKAHMELFASGKAVHAGTFNGHPLATASAAFILDYLAANEKVVYSHLERTAERLKQGLVGAARDAGTRCQVRGAGPVMCLEIDAELGSPADTTQAFQDELLARGVRIAQGGRWFVGYAHGEQEIEAAVSAAVAAFGALKHRRAEYATAQR